MAFKDVMNNKYMEGLFLVAQLIVILIFCFCCTFESEMRTHTADPNVIA